MIERKRTKSRHEAPRVDQQARKTALVVATVLALVALLNLYLGRGTLAIVLGAIAFVLVFTCLLMPGAARGFHRLWMSLAAVLGYVNSRILLSLLYYGMFTPYGLISRLIGRDPLLRRTAGGESYWVKREHTRQTKEQFEHLF